MKSKSIKLLTGIILLSILLVIIILVNTKSKNIQNKNVISYGISNSSNQIINTGDEIAKDLLFKNGFNFSFNQDLMEKRNYKILCFLDYKIVDFIIDDKNYTSYDFALSEKGNLKKNIKIAKEQDCKELSIAIIRMPYFMVEENDIARAIKTEDIISLRYNVESNNSSNQLIDSNSNINFKTIPINQDNIAFPYIYITKNINELTLITTSKEDNQFFLMLSNKEKTKTDYAVIALLNWNQVNINDKMVNFISVPSKSIIYSNLSFPKIEKDSNYQILVFPKPYNISKEDYDNLYIYGSHRVHLLKK